MSAPTATPFVLPAPDRRSQLDALVRESANHPAVHHPWLQRFANLEFGDPLDAVKTYAIEYSGYAAWFPRYLRCVIDRQDDARLREMLQHNLEEERGDLHPDDCDELRAVGIDPATVLGVPHPALYRRFCHSLGITDADLTEATAAAREWREQFLAYLQRATAAQAVGALGLGTESIVRPVYQQLLEGIRKLGTIRREDYVFFELHCLVDDQHQQDLLDCALELMRMPWAVNELRAGMLTALGLRQRFWNNLMRITSMRKAEIA